MKFTEQSKPRFSNARVDACTGAHMHRWTHAQVEERTGRRMVQQETLVGKRLQSGQMSAGRFSELWLVKATQLSAGAASFQKVSPFGLQDLSSDPEVSEELRAA